MPTAELHAWFNKFQNFFCYVYRYIQLEDCGHYFEVEGLDKFLGLGIKSDGAEIFTKLLVILQHLFVLIIN